jgi:hypothetical protein
VADLRRSGEADSRATAEKYARNPVLPAGTSELEAKLRAAVGHLQLYAPLGAETRRLLVELGSDAGEVALSLEAVGVRGEPHSKLDCVIGEYLSVIIGSEKVVREVRVTRRTVVIGKYRGVRRALVRLPRPVREFVEAFDAGAYPSLVRTSSPAGGQQVEESSHLEAPK